MAWALPLRAAPRPKLAVNSALASSAPLRSARALIWRCKQKSRGRMIGMSDPIFTAAFQMLPTASFLVSGATPPTDLALVSAGGELRFANRWALLAKFDGEFASHSSTYGGTGTIRYNW